MYWGVQLRNAQADTYPSAGGCTRPPDSLRGRPAQTTVLRQPPDRGELMCKRILGGEACGARGKMGRGGQGRGGGEQEDVVTVKPRKRWPTVTLHGDLHRMLIKRSAAVVVASALTLSDEFRANTYFMSCRKVARCSSRQLESSAFFLKDILNCGIRGSPPPRKHSLPLRISEQPRFDNCGTCSPEGKALASDTRSNRLSTTSA